MVLNGKQSQTLNVVQRVVEALGGEVHETDDVDADGEPVFQVWKHDDSDRSEHQFDFSLDEHGRAVGL